MQNEMGITLAALVLTIILMLILIGVTVNVATDGLLDRKNKATNEYYEEQKNTTDKIKSIEEEWSGVVF